MRFPAIIPSLLLMLQTASVANAFQSSGPAGLVRLQERDAHPSKATSRISSSQLREASEPKEDGEDELNDPFGEMRDLGETKRRGTHYSFGNGNDSGSGYNDYYAKEYGEAKNREREDFINNPRGSTMKPQFDFYLEPPPGVPNDNRKMLRQQAYEYGKAKHDQLEDFINNPHGRGLRNMYDYSIEPPGMPRNNNNPNNNGPRRQLKIPMQDQEDFINNPYGNKMGTDYHRNAKMAPGDEPFDLSRYERGNRRGKYQSQQDYRGEEKKTPIEPFDPRRYEGDFRGMPSPRNAPGPQNYDGPMGMPPPGPQNFQDGPPPGPRDFQDGPQPRPRDFQDGPPPPRSVFPMGMPLPEGNRPPPDQQRRTPVEPFEPNRYQRARMPPQEEFYPEGARPPQYYDDPRGMPPPGPYDFQDGPPPIPRAFGEEPTRTPNQVPNERSKAERRPVIPNSKIKPNQAPKEKTRSPNDKTPKAKTERTPVTPESKPLPGSVLFQRNPPAGPNPKRKAKVVSKATTTTQKPRTSQKPQSADKGTVERQWEALKEVAKKMNDGTIAQEIADKQPANGSGRNGMTAQQWQMFQEIAKQIEEEERPQTNGSDLTNAHFVSKKQNSEKNIPNDDIDVMDSYYDEMAPGSA